MRQNQWDRKICILRSLIWELDPSYTHRLCKKEKTTQSNQSTTPKSSTENSTPFFLKTGPTRSSIRWAMPRGVSNRGAVCKHAVQRLKTASISSWVCPTVRWCCDVVLKTPVWSNTLNIRAPLLLRISLTVLSVCSHSLRCSNKKGNH